MRPTTARRLLAALLLAAACGDSPSGPERADQIAFTRYTGREGPNVFVMNLDGTGLRQIDSLRFGHSPAWSPDGRRLAFIGADGGGGGLFVADLNAAGYRRLVTAEAYSPQWHANGGRIAYIERGSAFNSTASIVSVNLRGGDRRVLFAGGLYREIAVSRDESRIAWATSEQRICVARLSGGTAVCPVEGNSPTWLPDGRLSFSAYLEDPDHRGIYVMDADGGNRGRLTRRPVQEWWATWSPDGARVIIERSAENGTALDIMNADGSGLRPLPGAEGALVPSWRP